MPRRLVAQPGRLVQVLEQPPAHELQEVKAEIRAPGMQPLHIVIADAEQHSVLDAFERIGPPVVGGEPAEFADDLAGSEFVARPAQAEAALLDREHLARLVALLEDRFPGRTGPGRRERLQPVRGRGLHRRGACISGGHANRTSSMAA